VFTTEYGCACRQIFRIEHASVIRKTRNVAVKKRPQHVERQRATFDALSQSSSRYGNTMTQAGRSMSDIEQSILSTMAKRREEGHDEYRIVDRLTRRLGMGDNPRSRRSLYEWLAKLANEHGEPILEIISTALAQAVSARNAGRYFSVVVLKIAAEKGYKKNPIGGSVEW